MTTSPSFDHVHFYCTDIAASESWFVNVLGAAVTERRGSAAFPTIVISLGGGKILLRKQLEGESLGAPGAPRFGLDHFGLLADDVRDTVEDLRARGAVVSSEPRELRPGVFVAFVSGPDNVRVEIVQRPSAD
jgi:catechol 2,3-dioxygenase-like lactoylglutathione lyase family enzyme